MRHTEVCRNISYERKSNFFKVFNTCVNLVFLRPVSLLQDYVYTKKRVAFGFDSANNLEKEQPFSVSVSPNALKAICYGKLPLDRWTVQ